MGCILGVSKQFNKPSHGAKAFRDYGAVPRSQSHGLGWGEVGWESPLHCSSPPSKSTPLAGPGCPLKKEGGRRVTGSARWELGSCSSSELENSPSPKSGLFCHGVNCEPWVRIPKSLLSRHSHNANLGNYCQKSQQTELKIHLYNLPFCNL